MAEARTHGAAIALAACALLGAAANAMAAADGEVVMVLDVDGRDYTRYETLRAERAPTSAWLPVGIAAEDATLVVPRNYRETRLADGRTRLTFDADGYALMYESRLGGARLRRHNDTLIYDGAARAPQAAGDFGAYAYSWVVPANIEILDYQASRAGRWRHRHHTLSWQGHNVDEVAFTIRYRVHPPQRQAAPAAGSSQAPTDATEDRGTPAPPRSGRRPATLLLAPRAGLDLDAARPAAADSAPAHGHITLDGVVTLTDGRPEITARGQAVLAQLAQTLAAAGATRVIVTGPGFQHSRDTGGSAAQAARVADYLDAHGLDMQRIEIAIGEQGADAAAQRTIGVAVTPASALAGFSPP